MARDRFIPKREILPDIRFNNVLISKFINVMMLQGKKAVSQSIMYTALNECEKKTGKGGAEVFEKSIDNIRPLVEVKSRRVGGATYQVPIEVDEARGKALAIRWIIASSRKRSEKTMALKLAGELLDGFNKAGSSYKKKEDTHKMAEANKAFSHFRW
ncbi:MAG: 30S ribosomal protein S7 [Spirochaetes bacterium GWF1_31_7]|nr:MAG: 30S ribosomal protein S7 [Spirochaetes bacterium GWE1_32_154]OHD47324.1 MAG: 30S ribosomal protein S7 [Spirochaetes bacterium GWE2_31_10]OHD47384.1 MAG: 30S ribosomal protein S7 [Spirochaetes bacterium GWF1_31_7]OHD77261.1 MAG: 30S ribosomal protein S7 [Spirochaetes bacterium RIFOXYB1_FULL_32_8]HBI37345.1 30S ribosomal protein S7 [Spirochaetia bacterium]